MCRSHAFKISSRSCRYACSSVVPYKHSVLTNWGCYEFTFLWDGPYPPAQNQYLQENILGELIFARVHAGPVFALARIQENIFEGLFAAY